MSGEGLVSIIVPVYNSAEYIGECVESVLAQTYANYELLLIDDGSPDDSRALCEELCTRDERIRLIVQEHRGVSAARNAGMREAKGEYLFFLDSDDAIHPLLLEELVRQIICADAELALCDFIRMDSQGMTKAAAGVSTDDERPWWRVIRREEAERWFHIQCPRVLSGIGGMIRKDFIGEIRFDEELANGEDTLFLYNLICKQPQISYTGERWYYYRMWKGSVTHSSEVARGSRYWKASQVMRNSEYEKGRMNYAAAWESIFLYQLVRNYSEARRMRDKEGCRGLRAQAFIERSHPVFKSLPFESRLSFLGHIFGCPVYPWLGRHLPVLYKLYKWISGTAQKVKNTDIGILTFHCSDNYGAMLQAYALKNYLWKKGIDAQIVRYEPPYMTGRHWWIPYIPIKGVAGCLWIGLQSWKNHLKMGKDFFRMRANMEDFRKRYLIENGQRKLMFPGQLKKLSYRCYIVGSDQIWNPDITCGLRKVYFGAFYNRKREKVVAYGASLGGNSLSAKYDKHFSELLSHVDVISVREEEAVSYIRKFYQNDVTAVLDPVFLLAKRDWIEIERQPEADGYILVYATEKNDEMMCYAKRLSQEKNLPVIELRTTAIEETSFWADYTAGPSEFLGYIHKADYIISNSFHAVGFSIIYEKKFLVFQHSDRGARIRNILRIHELEDRIYKEKIEVDIDQPVDWYRVRQRMRETVKQSEDFLMKNIMRD